MSFYKLISSRHFSRYLKVFLLFSDLLILNLIYLISVYIRYQDITVAFRYDLRIVLVLSNICWILLTLYRDEYKLLRIERLEVVLGKTIRLFFLHAACIALAILILKFEGISRLRMLYFYIIFFISLSLFRVIFINFLKGARKKGYNNRSVVIVGVSKNGEDLNKFITNR